MSLLLLIGGYATPRVGSRRFGRTTVGAATVELAADAKVGADFYLPEAGNVVKLTAYLDGQGSGVGNQAVRGAVYSASSGALLGQSATVTVLDGQAAGWLDLDFNAPGLALTAGDYLLTLQGGTVSLTARAYRNASGTLNGGRSAADAFADGLATPFGTATALTSDLSVFATYYLPWSPPVAEPDAQLAALAFPDAQAVLGATGHDSSTRATGQCSWHGTLVDPQRGSFALAATGGALASFVGERVAITYDASPTARTVYAYVSDEADLDEGIDLSITRRLFMALAPAATTSLSVTVEALA